MSQLITTRDIYLPHTRAIKEPSYFEMHLMLKEKERLEREKEVLRKRISQIEQRVRHLETNMAAVEHAIKRSETGGR